MFEGIEFRDSVCGRLAYMKDSNLAVWEVILIAQDHDMDLARVATYFQRPISWVQAAFHYYARFHNEIDPFLEETRSMTYEKLKELLPQLETRVQQR